MSKCSLRLLSCSCRGETDEISHRLDCRVMRYDVENAPHHSMAFFLSVIATDLQEEPIL